MPPLNDRRAADPDPGLAAPTGGGATAAASAPPVSPRELRIVFAALMLAMTLGALDQSIVNTALPRMASDLGGLAHISWVVTAFMLTSTIVTPIYGKLSDMYGRRRLFVVSISLFLLASVLCGAAQTMTQLILFRALQGLGAGGLMTLAQTVIGDLVEPRERGRYQGLFTGAFAVSSVAGPLIGGGLTSALSWRWVFFVNLPVGALALGLILIGLRRAPPAVHHRIDYAGALLLAGAATCMLLLLGWGGSVLAWTSLPARALGLGSLVLLVLFVRQERHVAEPIMTLELFRIRSFATGVFASGTMAFAMLGTLVFLPLYFQLVLGLGPAQTGLMMLPQIGTMLLSSVIGGQLVSRFGWVKPFLVLGVGLEAVALGSLALLAFTGTGIMTFLIALGMLGLGMGIAMPNATVIVQNAVDRSALGVATATMAFVRSLGGALGVAVSGGVMAIHLGSSLAALGAHIDAHALIEGGMSSIAALPPAVHLAVIDAYREAIAFSFLVGGCVMTAAFVLTTTLKNVPARGEKPGPE